MMHSALYLSTKRKLGELLDRESIKRLPSGVDLHSTQHHDDDSHDQSQETTGIDDDISVLGLHGVHSICCFLFYEKWGTIITKILFLPSAKYKLKLNILTFKVCHFQSLAANLEPQKSLYAV